MRPSPCHAKAPTVAGVVAKYVARYVPVVAFEVSTDGREESCSVSESSDGIYTSRLTVQVQNLSSCELLLKLTIVQLELCGSRVVA